MSDFLDDGTKPRLTFDRNRNGDKIALSVSHDRAKSVFGFSSRDNTGLELLGEHWAKVIPALVVLMTESERAECLKGIAERLGVEVVGEQPRKCLPADDDSNVGSCPACGEKFVLVRPGKSQPSCTCHMTCSGCGGEYDHIEEPNVRWYGCKACGRGVPSKSTAVTHW